MTTTDIAGLFALTGQVAFVTGAGKGLGRAICAGFAQAGADIVAVARTASDLEETAREVRAQGRRCLTVTCDVTLDAQVEAAVEKAVEEFGKIDILVNNAGGAINVHALMELPEEEWDSQLDLNLKAAFLCSRAVAKSMMKLGRGKIINIGSRNGFVPSAGSSAPYNVAKAGLNNLTKQLAAEWGDKGIWVNGMAVSAMRTPPSWKQSVPASNGDWAGSGSLPPTGTGHPSRSAWLSPRPMSPSPSSWRRPRPTTSPGTLSALEVWLSTEPDRVDHEGHNRVNSDSVRGRLDRTAL